jgi:putative peptidoglycan lipid II flippase
MIKSSLFVTFITLCSSFLGFIIQILMAKKFGIGLELDAYFFALSLPTFIAGLVSSMLSYTVLGRVAGFQRNIQFQHSYIKTILIIFIIISIMMLFLGFFVISKGNYFIPYEKVLREFPAFKTILYVAWVVGSFQIIQGSLTAILGGLRKYISAASVALFPYFGIMGAIIFSQSNSIVPIIEGFLIGTFIASLFAILVLNKVLKEIASSAFLWGEIKPLFRSSLFALFGMISFTSYSVIDSYWASRSGVGVLTTLSYAQRIIVASSGLVVAGPLAILIPKLAKYHAERNHFAFRQLMIKSVFLIGLASVCISCLIAYFSTLIVSLLFYRGEFGLQQVGLVAGALRYMSFGMAAMLISNILLRVLFLFEKGELIGAVLGAGWAIFYFIQSSIFYLHGATGIAIGYSVAWFIYLTFLIFFTFNSIFKMSTSGEIKAM